MLCPTCGDLAAALDSAGRCEHCAEEQDNPPRLVPCGYCARCGYGNTGDGSDACLHKQYR